MSEIGQTGQSEAIHSPEAWASMVVRLTRPAAWSMPVVTFRYASLSSGLEIVRKTLGQHQIAAIQTSHL
jgi:hypothetical protein